MASRRLVLVTGINGYIAAHTAATFLRAGYAVRGTVRAATSASEPLVRALNQHHDGDRLELFEVPDVSVSGAFDRAVQGVDAIAHLASPVSVTETDPLPVMRAAVEGTTSLLGSALAEWQAKKGALRSFVFASSISAVFSPARSPGHVFTEADWNDVAEEEVRRLGSDVSGYALYQASKTAAERAFWRFGEEKAAGFGMVALCPAPVLGPPLYLPEPISKLSMRVNDIYQLLRGAPIPEFSPIRSTFVDVRDVAELVYQCVDKDFQGQALGTRERYLLVGQQLVSPQQMADVLRARFPECKDRVREGNPGEKYPDMTWKYDATKARDLLGRDWTGFQKSVEESAQVFVDAKIV
ncbi:putative NADPH-dependent methylglyoxal reductase GRP2 [Madurella mycetomatis]|uniref:Putative NADPH-dependent methylglyoxal reductase GRP2 n=1 Tax=Madurella mycetomatis TaxID=100816 RepID=A0A175VW05_9PEZI|nr:putative NADPH-dependent methylglyoxal reductase GRP2 [Madurella mycetomatis]KXX82347.1 putative NADPH-dependent methylglyoxal reductase GRP2 [Madurella mycetomatis]